MNEIVIRVKVSVIGGKYATNKNAHLFRLEKLRPGCNVLGNPRIPDPKNYREVYRIEKDFWQEWENGKATRRKKKGYSFVEVNHRMGGFGGVQKSVRALIKQACFGIFGMRDDYKLVFEGEAK